MNQVPRLVDEVIARVLGGPLELRLEQLLAQLEQRGDPVDLLPLPAHAAHL